MVDAPHQHIAVKRERNVEMTKRDRQVQERRREWNQAWTRTWRPWTETHPEIQALTLKVKAAGVEALGPLKRDVSTYSAESVPFHSCGNPVCSIGGIDLRPLVLEAIIEHKETFHTIALCKGMEGGTPRSCSRSVDVSGSITYKRPAEHE